MPPAPWFKLHVGWWLTTQEIAVLLPEQEGALIRLLCFAWGDGTTPPLLDDDPDQLAIISKLGARWATLGPAILRLWQVREEDGKLYNPIQYEAWMEMAEASARRRVAGAKGGRGHKRLPAELTPDGKDKFAMEVWEAIRELYPSRAGGQAWRDAEIGYRARLAEGVDPRKMLEGVQRFRAFHEAENNIGTGFVMQARRFFGPGKHWEEEWTPSTRAGSVRAAGRQSAADRQRDAFRALDGGGK